MNNKPLILCIYEILKKHSDEHKRLQQKTIQAYLEKEYNISGVHPQTIKENIDTLRNLGYVILPNKPRCRGVYLQKPSVAGGAFLMNILTNTQAISKEQVEDIVENVIFASYSNNFREIYKNYKEEIKAISESDNKTCFSNLENINLAIYEHKKLKIKTSSKNQEIIVSPIWLTMSGEPILIFVYNKKLKAVPISNIQRAKKSNINADNVSTEKVKAAYLDTKKLMYIRLSKYDPSDLPRIKSYFGEIVEYTDENKNKIVVIQETTEADLMGWLLLPSNWYIKVLEPEYSIVHMYNKEDISVLSAKNIQTKITDENNGLITAVVFGTYARIKSILVKQEIKHEFINDSVDRNKNLNKAKKAINNIRNLFIKSPNNRY